MGTERQLETARAVHGAELRDVTSGLRGSVGSSQAAQLAAAARTGCGANNIPTNRSVATHSTASDLRARTRWCGSILAATSTFCIPYAAFHWMEKIMFS